MSVMDASRVIAEVVLKMCVPDCTSIVEEKCIVAIPDAIAQEGKYIAVIPDVIVQEDDDEGEFSFESMWRKATGQRQFEDDDVLEDGDGKSSTKAVVEERKLMSLQVSFGEITIALPQDEPSISCIVWRGSLLIAAKLAGFPTKMVEDTQLIETFADEMAWRTQNNEYWADKDVLELGCGRGLPGILAGRLGARRVLLTDCDDRALIGLEKLGLPDMFELKHLLWEQDQKDEENAKLEFPNTDIIRHWRDVHRCDRFQELGTNDMFDLIIASDCLYFTAQEEPLAASLRRRLRKPNGIAVIAIQTRQNGGFQTVRFRQALEESGLKVQYEHCMWDWDTMMNSHIYKTAGQEAARLGVTGKEVGDHHFLTIGWDIPQAGHPK